MRSYSFIAKVVIGIVGSTALGIAPLNFGLAHEGHKMECNETSINAMNADVQAMKDGDDKTAAMKEMQMAQDMMTKNDTKGCTAHLHNAMEATEK